MEESNLDCAGYYMLYGFPCEVRELDDECGYEGFMYIPGKGLSACDVTTIIFEGRVISEQQFKDSVIFYARHGSA